MTIPIPNIYAIRDGSTHAFPYHRTLVMTQPCLYMEKPDWTRRGDVPAWEVSFLLSPPAQSLH